MSNVAHAPTAQTVAVRRRGARRGRGCPPIGGGAGRSLTIGPRQSPTQTHRLGASVCTASAPCSTIWPRSPTTASSLPWLMPSPSTSSLDRLRCSEKLSSCSGFAWNVPSNAFANFLFHSEKQQIDSRMVSKFSLIDIGKDEDADGIKSWLRSQYADCIRERKRGAAARDFDLIGTEFHRWVRDRREALGLIAGSEFARSIERDFAFYSRWHERLRKAGETSLSGVRLVGHIAPLPGVRCIYTVINEPQR